MTAPSQPDLKELLARVEKATGRDQTLDAAIADALGVQPSVSGPVNPGVGPIRSYKLYTSSLDAALALKAQIAPEWRVELTEGADYWVASLISGVDAYSEPAPTAPLALLKTLIAKENDRG